MKISDLIERLQAELAQHGDVPVVWAGEWEGEPIGGSEPALAFAEGWLWISEGAARETWDETYVAPPSAAEARAERSRLSAAYHAAVEALPPEERLEFFRKYPNLEDFRDRDEDKVTNG